MSNVKSEWLAQPLLSRRAKKKKDYLQVIFIAFMAAAASFLVHSFHYQLGFFGGKIKTEVGEDEHKILCPSGYCYKTYVWYNGELLEVWYDDLQTVTDSIKQTRIMWGKDLLHKAK